MKQIADAFSNGFFELTNPYLADNYFILSSKKNNEQLNERN